MKPTSSKGRSPWKVNKASQAGGIVIPKGAIVVNQGLRKVKLEEDYVDRKPVLPVSMEIENDVTSTATGGGGSCSCGKEIESLKCAVKELSLQVGKQNQVIREIKSGLKNAVMSLMACYNNDGDDDEAQDEGHRYDSSDSQESREKTCGFTTAEDCIILGDSQDSLENENFPIVDHDAQITVDDDNGVDIDKEDNEDASNLAEDSRNGTCEADPDQNLKEPQESDHHEKLELQDLPRKKRTSERKRMQDNLKGKHDLASSAAVSLESEKSTENDLIEDESDVNDNAKSNHGCPSDLEMRMRNHIIRVHSKRQAAKSRKCNLCAKTFANVSNLNKHIRQAHEGIRYKCDYCPAIFTKRETVLLHEKMVHAEGCAPTQQCKICGSYLRKQRSALVLHMKMMHTKSGSGSTSSGESSHSFSKKKVKCSKRKKTVKMTRTIIFQCQHCPISFPKREDLHGHLNQVHGITFLSGAGGSEVGG